MKTKYRKTLQLYIKIPIIKYIVYVLYKIKSSQNTLDRNTPYLSCKENVTQCTVLCQALKI
jgi:hypothetical protein